MKEDQLDLFGHGNGDGGDDHEKKHTRLSWELAFEDAVMALPKGTRFLTDDIVEKVGMPPDEPNNVGTKTRELAEAGYIRDTGVRAQSTRASRHGAEVHWWERQ